jgi:hypothetical protein
MSRRPSFTRALAVAAVLTLGMSHAQALPILFDSYTSPGSGVQVVNGLAGGGNPNPAVPLSNNQFAVTGLFAGSQREITIQRLGGTGTFDANINTTIPGAWSVANGLMTGNIATTRYDFAGQGFSLDFSGVGSIDLTQINLDAGQVDFSIELSGGAGTFTTASQSVSGNVVNGSLIFSLGAVPAGILNSVDSIRILANSSIPGPNGLAGSDFSVGAVFIPDDTVIIQEVPEPASMVVFGLLTVTGGLIARRRMTKAAA